MERVPARRGRTRLGSGRCRGSLRRRAGRRGPLPRPGPGGAGRVRRGGDHHGQDREDLDGQGGRRRDRAHQRSGLTLYRFTMDSPGTSTCTGACATIWPPLLAPKGAHVSGPHGVKGLSLLKVGNGHWQVAFDKIPLYRFEGDKKKGQAHGQNVEGAWFAVLKSGIPASAVTAAPAAHTDHGARRLDHTAGDADDAGRRTRTRAPGRTRPRRRRRRHRRRPRRPSRRPRSPRHRRHRTDHDAADVPAAHDHPHDQCRWRRVWLLGPRQAGFASGPGPSSAPRRPSPSWGGVRSPAPRAGRGTPW